MNYNSVSHLVTVFVLGRQTTRARLRELLAAHIFLMFFLRGEKLNYKTVAKEISKPPYFWLLKSSGHQSLPCLFDASFLSMFLTTPIFGMSRDHNRKRLKARTEWIVPEI